MWSDVRPTHLGNGRPLHAWTRGDSLAALVYRGLTVLLAALAVVGQGALLDALYLQDVGLGTLGLGAVRPALLSALVTGAVVSVLSAALGVALAVRRDDGRGSRPLGLALAVWAYLLAYSGIVVLAAPGIGSPLRRPFDAHFLLVEALGLAALIRFSALFPNPLGPEVLRDPATLPPGAATVQRMRRWFLRPAAPWIAGLLAVAATFGVNAAMRHPVEDAALLPLADLLRVVALGLVVMNLRRSYLSSDAAGRAPLTWVILGFALLVAAVGLVLGGNVLAAATGWELRGVNWRPIVLHLGVVGLLAGAGMGIFYRGAVGPGPLVRRVAVLSGMATLALFLAAGLETLLTGAVTRFSMPSGTGTFLALVVTSLVYGRTRRPLEAFLAQPWVETRPPAPAER